MAQSRTWNPILHDEDVLRADWRDTNHAHRLQINFAVSLHGSESSPRGAAELLLPPPSEIAFVLSLHGIDIKPPLDPSIKVHRAAAVTGDPMVLPQDPDRLDFKRKALIRGRTYDPFILFCCSNARTSDVAGYNEEHGIFEGVEICVHVLRELNPSLSASAHSSFIFSRLGSVDCNGTHFAAHVSLAIALATRPPLESKEAANSSAVSLFWGTKSVESTANEAPSQRMPPVVPILSTMPAQPEVPSLAKSIAQIRMDSARRRQQERWTQIRLDTARWRALDEQKQHHAIVCAQLPSSARVNKSASHARSLAKPNSARHPVML